jgi:hypothetical protein
MAVSAVAKLLTLAFQSTCVWRSAATASASLAAFLVFLMRDSSGASEHDLP